MKSIGGKKIYYLINALVLLLTVYLVVYTYGSRVLEVLSGSWIHILCLLFIVLAVNVIKAVRFGFLIVGNTAVSKDEFLKQYFKTVPVSVVLPYKLGELFRVYCFGFKMNSLLLGLVYVVIDRFFDTVALLLILVGLSGVAGQQFSEIAFILTLFIAAIILMFFTVPVICMYWKNYFLRIKATKRTIVALKAVSFIESTCLKVKSVVRGKGIIALFLSLLAWFIELAGTWLMNSLLGNSVGANYFQNYLMSALGNNNSDDLNAFVVATVIVLFIGYIVFYTRIFMKGRKNNEY